MTETDGSRSDQDGSIKDTLLESRIVSHGHFRYESGHHGTLWLDLDALFADATRLQEFAAVLAGQAADCRPDVICGPLTGGAFLAQFMAAELRTVFAFSERIAEPGGPVRYVIPTSLRSRFDRKRVLFVDDAINAGSALRLTLADAIAWGAEPVGLASLISFGNAAVALAAEYGVPFFSLASLERGMWAADACPLCAADQPLTQPANRLR